MMFFKRKNDSIVSSNSSDKVKNITIVGLPNTGKSQVFNNLTGEYTIVANYPLSTVTTKKARCQIGNNCCKIIDTPGLHCLYMHSEEELVVREMLFSEKPDVIVQCIDANQLKQSLILTADLLELEIPIVISLNSIDETSRSGIWIDSSRLSSLLGIPVVESVAVRNVGTEELKDAINNARNGKSSVKYGDFIEDGIFNLGSKLPQQTNFKRKASILILQDDPYLVNNIEKLHGDRKSAQLVREADRIKQRFRGNLAYAINNKRNKWVDDITEQVIRKQKITLGEFPQVFAHLSRHPIFGLPILMPIIFIMYFLVVNVANVIAVWMDGTFWVPVHNLIDKLVSSQFWNDFLIGDYGILSLGLANAFITILPILLVFFLLYSTLEDIGYIPNLSVLVRRIFEKVGLSGAAIMPLVLGFGCKTMATMSTKSLHSNKERYIAIYLIAFAIPCAPQMALNMSILGRMGVMAFVIAFSTLALVEIVAGMILNRVLKEEEKTDFIQVLPAIRIPSVKAVLKKTYYRLYWFIKEAVPVFIYASFILFVIDKLGILNTLKTFLEPTINGLLGLPIQMVDALILTMARHEAAAGMIIKLIERGELNYVQSIVSITITTMFIPCFANIMAMIKEQGVKRTLTMVAIINGSAFIMAALLNLILVVIFKL